MRLVFVGTTRFGLRCLDVARSLNDWDVVGVVTAPERLAISYRPEGVLNVLHADVASYCRERDLPYTVIEQGMKGDGLFETACTWRPDAFLVVGWYHMIPTRWRVLAPAYGLHASLLPDYSGGAPLVWALINGERKTGITLFELADGVDNGPILGQAEMPIAEDDTIATLYGRIEEAGLGLVAEYLPAVAHGTAKRIPQDERKRRVFPQRSPADGRINWRQSADELYNFVRAQTKPYPGAFTSWRGQRMTIWSVAKRRSDTVGTAVAGVVSMNGDRPLVQTGRGMIELTEVEIEGRTLRGAALRELAPIEILGS